MVGCLYSGEAPSGRGLLPIHKLGSKYTPVPTHRCRGRIVYGFAEYTPLIVLVQGRAAAWLFGRETLVITYGMLGMDERLGAGFMWTPLCNRLDCQDTVRFGTHRYIH